MQRLFLITILGLLLISTAAPIDKIKIGIDEQLGKHIPLNAVFNDEDSNQVKLGDLITEPTVLALVYYHCPGICNPLMFELANVMNKSDLEPGYDYNVICISIDDLETPQKATQKKKEMMSAFDKNISRDSWRFLTGTKENIRKVSDAAGYYFKREGTEFRHSGALIFIDKTGKICRYLIPSYTENHGFGILPFDFKMAVLETSKGKETPTIARELQLCFSSDPQGETYALNFTRIFGVAILIFVGIFVLVTKKKPKKEKIK